MFVKSVEWIAVIVVFLCVYWLGYAFYQLFLSPLASVPGPKLAAISNAFTMWYDLVGDARMPWKLKKLHTQYGKTRS